MRPGLGYADVRRVLLLERARASACRTAEWAGFTLVAMACGGLQDAWEAPPGARWEAFVGGIVTYPWGPAVAAVGLVYFVRLTRRHAAALDELLWSLRPTGIVFADAKGRAVEVNGDVLEAYPDVLP